MTKDTDDVHTSSSPGEQAFENGAKDEAVVGTDSEGQPVVVEPFGRDGASHRITIGSTRSGRTAGVQQRRFADWFDENDEVDDDREVFEIDWEDGEMTEIEDVEGLEELDSINPLDIPTESADESGEQSSTGGDDS
jgi:hypothetical protein